jgi:hypothetical protein
MTSRRLANERGGTSLSMSALSIGGTAGKTVGHSLRASAAMACGSALDRQMTLRSLHDQGDDQVAKAVGVAERDDRQVRVVRPIPIDLAYLPPVRLHLGVGGGNPRGAPLLPLVILTRHSCPPRAPADRPGPEDPPAQGGPRARSMGPRSPARRRPAPPAARTDRSGRERRPSTGGPGKPGTTRRRLEPTWPRGAHRRGAARFRPNAVAQAAAAASRAARRPFPPAGCLDHGDRRRGPAHRGLPEPGRGYSSAQAWFARERAREKLRMYTRPEEEHNP